MMGLRDLLYFLRRPTFSWVSPYTQVKASKIHGKGRFAAKEIQAGEIIAIVGGYIVDLRQEKLVSGLQISERFAIRGSFLHGGNNSINHSCLPTCRIEGDIFVVSDRLISCGEELTLDYGSFLYSKDRAEFIKKCTCDSLACRGKVTGDDWRVISEHLLNRFLKELRSGN